MLAKRNRTNLAKIVLEVVGLDEILSFDNLIVNIVGFLLPTQKRKYNQKFQTKVAVKRLINKGLIDYHKSNKGLIFLRLTDKGREELKKYSLQDLTIKKPKRWDGKYRVIIFDIKEFKRSVRDKMRRWLEHLGFVRLQNSVWVYPYECREVIVLLKSFFHIGKEVLYMTVDSIENDKWLRREFDLN